MKRLSYWMILFLVGLLTPRLSGPCLSGPVWAHVYELKQQIVRPDKETEHVLLRLYNTATERTVWKRTVGRLGKIGWSPDHRALAAIVFLNDNFLHLLVWRKGHSPYIYALGPQGALGDDAIDFVWSADQRRLLFRIGGSGSFDLNTGTLYALNLQRRQLYTVSEASVRKMGWQGPHRVRYWIAGYVPLKHPVNGGSLDLVVFQGSVLG